MTKEIIPAAALADHIAILGKTGSGKSNAAKTIVEGLLASGERVCVLDPTGTWWGLRLTKAGKPSPHEIVIFGGKRADIPIADQHGTAIAETIGTSATPAIIDTRMMTVGQRTLFSTGFAETLLRLCIVPLHLVIDEAHLFAPQGKVNDPKSGMMLHAFNNLVSLGRGIGLRIILISQRPAKLHNDTLSQCETLVAMRMILPHDRAAVREWVKDYDTEGKGGEIVKSLPTMKTGEAWVWSPQHEFLERSKFPLAATFDSGRLRDDAGAVDLKPIDLAAVSQRLGKVAADAIANDPARLKAENARLKAELERRDTQEAPAVTHANLTAEYDRGWNDRAEAAQADLDQLASIDGDLIRRAAEGLVADIVEFIGEARQILTENAKHKKKRPAVTAAANAAKRAATPPQAAVQRPAPSARPSPPGNGASAPAPASGDDRPLGSERKMLAALAAVYPAGMTEGQWAIASGVKRGGSSLRSYRSRLNAAGRIEKRGNEYFATAQGIADLGDTVVALPPPGMERVEYWAGKISGAGKMLRLLAEAYPDAIDPDALAAAIDVEPGGSSFRSYRSRLRSPGLIEIVGDGALRAADALMQGP